VNRGADHSKNKESFFYFDDSFYHRIPFALIYQHEILQTFSGLS